MVKLKKSHIILFHFFYKINTTNIARADTKKKTTFSYPNSQEKGNTSIPFQQPLARFILLQILGNHEEPTRVEL
jgi:hypothetical protein